jgi:hypothetical protein
MAGEHWRDLHRNLRGGFLPRPGKKGFVDPKAQPKADTKETTASTTSSTTSSSTASGKALASWVRQNRSSG